MFLCANKDQSFGNSQRRGRGGGGGVNDGLESFKSALKESFLTDALSNIIDFLLSSHNLSYSLNFGYISVERRVFEIGLKLLHRFYIY